MATRSNIGYIMPNGNIRSVYCHWDGYPSHNGRILQDHYQSAYKIAQLVELGDLSSLDAEIGRQVDFDDREAQKGQCVYYGRDRGETGTETQEISDVQDFVQNDYAYLWTGAEWVMYSPATGNVGVALSAVLEQLEVMA